MSATKWRFIPCDSFDGATNMAIDEAILEARVKGLVPPTLRLYLFVPPCVTIGLSQKLAPEVVAGIEDRGIDVVRRPTGGRAVLHMNDLTYSFVGSDTSVNDGFLSTGVTESYKQICCGLIEAFAELGVQSEIGASGVAYRHLQDCFMATTGSDLQHEGTKLIGSAQTRRRGSILQHGSVPLNQDPGLMAKILGEPETDKARHRNLFDIAGRDLSMAEMSSAFKTGFEHAFGVTLLEGALTDFEQEEVKRLKSVSMQLAL